MKKILLVLAVVALLTSCSVRVSDNVKTERFVNKVAYFQDQNTGAVFAVVAIKTGVNAQEDGVGLAYIPKAEVSPAIKGMIKNYKEWQ